MPKKSHTPLQAGLPRTIAALVVLPSIGVATGMHYSPEFRAMVEERAPGATDALSKLTGASYSSSQDPEKKKESTKSTLPEHFEDIPDILQRIENSSEQTQKSSEVGSSSGSSSPPDAAGSLAAMIGLKDKVESGATEAAANAEDLAKKVNGTVKSAMKYGKDSPASESSPESSLLRESVYNHPFQAFRHR